MVELRETEAVAYLERLNEVSSNLGEEPPFCFLRNAFQLELSYFRRLLRDDAKRDLAVLVVKPTGFPELLPLMVDIQKAYQELDSIESNIGNSIFPLLNHLENSKDLTAYDVGIDRITADFKQDQEHIDLLTKLQPNIKLLNIGRVATPKIVDSYNAGSNENKKSFIFTKNDCPGLIFYETGGEPIRKSNERMGWWYKEGFIKYIDTIKFTPLLLVYSRNAFQYDYYQEKYIRREENWHLETFPDLPEILSVLNPLDEKFRERFLSVDFTTLPDGAYVDFFKSSAKMGTLLEHIKINQLQVVAPSVPEKQKPKHWWDWKNKN